MSLLTRELDAAAIDYALCGAIALAIHGVPRATKDIDLMIAPGDLERFRAVARSWASRSKRRVGHRTSSMCNDSLRYPMTVSKADLVTQRLRRMAELSKTSPPPAGLDYGAQAITARLREVSEL